MKTGKRYSEAAKLIEKTKTYDLEEAVAQSLMRQSKLTSVWA